MSFNEGHGNRILSRAMLRRVGLGGDRCEDSFWGKHERARWLATGGGGVRHGEQLIKCLEARDTKFQDGVVI